MATTIVVVLLLLGTLTICHGGYSGYSSSELYGTRHRDVYGNDQGKYVGGENGAAGYGQGEQYGRDYKGSDRNELVHDNNYKGEYDHAEYSSNKSDGKKNGENKYQYDNNNSFGKEERGYGQYNNNVYGKNRDQSTYGNGGQYKDGYGDVGNYNDGYGIGSGKGNYGYGRKYGYGGVDSLGRNYGCGCGCGNGNGKYEDGQMYCIMSNKQAP